MNTFSPVEVLQDFTPRTEAQVDTPELIVAAQDVLMQGLGLLFELGDRTYSLVAGTPFNASVGQHYRHVLEHFQSLIRGLRAGEINYDARERNQRLQSEFPAGRPGCLRDKAAEPWMVCPRAPG